MLLSSSSDEEVESGSPEFRQKHMAINTNEANQPSPDSPSISGDAKCRDDPHRVVPTIPSIENTSDIGEGPPFCANTWAPQPRRNYFGASNPSRPQPSLRRS
ncbi:hypothetical protein FXO38_30186 [Capsicum annuum]|nr:hypothetical protein FXO38_30186 [Capsicum annuum]